MQYFVWQSTKSGRCAVLNQYYKSTISDEVFNIISKKVDVNGNICEISDKFFEYENKHRKKIENENDSQFEDRRDINQDETSKYVNGKQSKLPLQKNYKN